MQSKIFHIVILVLVIALIAAFGWGYWSLKEQISDVQTLIKFSKQAEQPSSSIDLDMDQPAPVVQPAETDPVQVLAAFAQKAIQAMKDQDMAELSGYAHPAKGVRFSPYANVKNDDLVFTAEQVKGLLNSSTQYDWGMYDVSGMSIDKTFQEYYDEFIYDQDFSRSDKVSLNAILGKGNTLINISEFYPNSQFIEFYIPGTDPQSPEMSWNSLILVFEQVNGQWYLIGVAHNEWTI